LQKVLSEDPNGQFRRRAEDLDWPSPRIGGGRTAEQAIPF